MSEMSPGPRQDRRQGAGENAEAAGGRGSGSQDPPGGVEFDEHWEAWARGLLEEAGHDPELGVRIARDAQRVVAGKLSEEEFRDAYHQDLLERHGQDHRPRLSDGLARPGEAPRPAVDRTQLPLISRRQALRSIGGTAVGMLFLGEVLRAGDAFGAEAGQPGILGDGSGEAQVGFVIDLERCTGCKACSFACNDHHQLDEGNLWMHVFSYKEPEDPADALPRYMPRLCQHCTNAPCVMVCPTSARHRRLADGLVLTDYDICIGCRYCQVACPYGVNFFQWREPAVWGQSAHYEDHPYDHRGRAVEHQPPRGVMGKCTFDPQHQDDPERCGTAACVDACKELALHIGDLNDPDSPPNRYLRQRQEEAAAEGRELPTFRLLEDLNTQPNCIYIGAPPTSRAELVDPEAPALSYEELGLVEDRLEHLQEERPEVWWRRMVNGEEE